MIPDGSRIRALCAENGTVTVSPQNAAKGRTVTITPKPEEGFRVDQVTVTDKDGNPVEVKDNGDGTYSFIMPASPVDVNVTFIPDEPVPEADKDRFVDVPKGTWFYDAVYWAVGKGITDGVDETHFAPNSPCTRAQMVTFLWRAAGSPEPAGDASRFSDVVRDSYYEKAVAWAIENGITDGTSDTTFSPDDTVIRAQSVAFLYRFAKAHAEPSDIFDDVALDAWYAEAVAWAAEDGITDGVDDTHFAPDSDCLRAQIVTFLYRLLGEA